MTDLNQNVAHVLTYIIPRIQERQSQASSGVDACSKHRVAPFILALSGLQGSGKSTWATALVRALNEDHHIRAITVSLDDFYKTHAGLLETRDSNPGNGLLRTRGQPGTHDEILAEEFFGTLTDGRQSHLRVPFFDKSQFNGEGDRAAGEDWKRVSRTEPIDVLVFEGWCVGFQALSEETLHRKWLGASNVDYHEPTERAPEYAIVTLPEHPLEHLRALNDNLKRYNVTFMGPQHFDYVVHLDTDDLANVYDWRMQQEQAMRRATQKMGMSKEQVISFVRGYMPAYELYLEQLRSGMQEEAGSGKRPGQLRVLLDQQRTVLSVAEVVT